MVPFRVSGGIDYFASTKEEAYNWVKNIFLKKFFFLTLNYGYLPEEPVECDDPLFSPKELNRPATQDNESHQILN